MNLLENEQVKQCLCYLKEDDERTLREQLELVQMPAPSFHEEKRAKYVYDKFREIGLEDVTIDEIGNVTGKLSGTEEGPSIMLAAHTDTVFPMETDLTVRKEGNRYYCPGINDDTRAVAELFSIARAMIASGLRTRGNLIFCANVCEEGLGDLKGVKYLFEKETKPDAFVTIDNLAMEGIIYTATGSNRFEVTFEGRGGHSFSDFGLPNPIHAMGRAIAEIADFKVPKNPKTTFNVGVIQGGTSVNTIASKASMLIDIRSDSKEELENMTEKMKAAVKRAAEQETTRWESDEKVTVEITPKGVRPAGTQEKECAIVQAAIEASKMLGIQPQLRDESSTDANIPISMGIPAIALGRGGKEGGVHTKEEWFEADEAWLGPQRDVLCLLLLAEKIEKRRCNERLKKNLCNRK